MDPTISTNLFHRKIVLCATVELIKQGAKTLKKIDCEGFMNSFINVSIVLYSYKSQQVLLTCSKAELVFMIISHLPLFKLRLTKSHCIFYYFIVCYFLVCKSLPKSQFSSKFRLDCSSMCMVIDLVTYWHFQCAFPHLFRKDTMDIIESNQLRKKTRRPGHFTLLLKIRDQRVLQRDYLGD